LSSDGICLQNAEMRFHQKLTRVIDEANLSDREAAKRLGNVSPTTVARWKSGETEPKLSDIALIARLFKLPMVYLADDSLDEVPGSGMTADEEQLLKTSRALNGGAAEAIRRILNFATYVPAASHVELTDATLLREKELMRPKRVEKTKVPEARVGAKSRKK
jgi:transcriptional regulator with XRE-family HTH domain